MTPSFEARKDTPAANWCAGVHTETRADVSAGRSSRRHLALLIRDIADGEDEIRVSLADLANLSGYDRRTVQRRLDDLVEHFGLIEVGRAPGAPRARGKRPVFRFPDATHVPNSERDANSRRNSVDADSRRNSTERCDTSTQHMRQKVASSDGGGGAPSGGPEAPSGPSIHPHGQGGGSGRRQAGRINSKKITDENLRDDAWGSALAVDANLAAAVRPYVESTARYVLALPTADECDTYAGYVKRFRGSLFTHRVREKDWATAADVEVVEADRAAGWPCKPKPAKTRQAAISTSHASKTESDDFFEQLLARREVAAQA